MQNLMQIHCSSHSVILNVTATQYTCSVNGIYCSHWLVQWSCHCSHMCIPVHSPWLPGSIDVMQTTIVYIKKGWTCFGQTLHTPVLNKKKWTQHTIPLCLDSHILWYWTFLGKCGLSFGEIPSPWCWVRGICSKEVTGADLMIKSIWPHHQGAGEAKFEPQFHVALESINEVSQERRQPHRGCRGGKEGIPYLI